MRAYGESVDFHITPTYMGSTKRTPNQMVREATSRRLAETQYRGSIDDLTSKSFLCKLIFIIVNTSSALLRLSSFNPFLFSFY